MIDRDKNILIVGLGLMGGSYAQRLKDIGYKVYGIDINEEVVNKAIREKVIEPELGDDYLIRHADIIVLCLYPKDNVRWIKNHHYQLKSGAIISDISGVKANIVEEIQKSIRSDVEFISMHPMAGKELSGFDNRDTNMFLPANMIVVPTSRNSKEAIMFAYDLAVLLRFKNVELLSIDAHDKMIGYLSQLPHAIAVALINCQDSSHLHRYTGDSFRDLTRIAKINESLWSELFFENKDNLLPLIDSFVEELQKLKSYVENNDEENLKEMFKESTRRRKEFDK